jgi:hypothetical protein
MLLKSGTWGPHKGEVELWEGRTSLMRGPQQSLK